ncbi:hypothetical protein OF83DRAFT_1112543 [Amylostereum chailletii]|nr:hypothetical protein OF83DRAFT_1112543 [Amylostereum chailletii]
MENPFPTFHAMPFSTKPQFNLLVSLAAFASSSLGAVASIFAIALGAIVPIARPAPAPAITTNLLRPTAPKRLVSIVESAPPPPPYTPSTSSPGKDDATPPYSHIANGAKPPKRSKPLPKLTIHIPGAATASRALANHPRPCSATKLKSTLHNLVTTSSSPVSSCLTPFRPHFRRRDTAPSPASEEKTCNAGVDSVRVGMNRTSSWEVPRSSTFDGKAT